MRAAEYWDREVRLDGITTHKEALELIAQKARDSKPGEWVLVLGGWSEEQFTDEKRGFTKAELDEIAPDNPVVIQLIYFRIYANSAGLKALGIDETTPDMPGGKIEKDGTPTGVLNGAGAVAFALSKLGEVARDKMIENARALMYDLNRLGITAYEDMGGRGLHAGHVEAFRAVHERRQMTVRAFYRFFVSDGPPEVERLVARIAQLKPFQGDDYFDILGMGGTFFRGRATISLAKTGSVTPEQMRNWRRVAQVIADRGLSANIHTTLRGTIGSPFSPRWRTSARSGRSRTSWSFSHLDQVEPEDLERTKRLGMAAMIHSRPSIQGAMLLKIHGERATPCRRSA